MRLGPHGAIQPIPTFPNPANEIYLFLDDDGDGDTDVILARNPNATPTGGVRRIACNGNGTFGPVTLLGVESTKILKFLKFDAEGDGDFDVLVMLDTVNPSVRWYLSDPGGTIRTGTTSLPSDKIALADYDGDGMAEIICSYSLGIFQYEWDGTSFVQQQFISIPNTYRSTSWDYDRDGLKDLLAQGKAFRNLGAAGLSPTGVDLGVSAPIFAGLFDLDNDGYEELIWNDQNNTVPISVKLGYQSSSSFRPTFQGTAQILNFAYLSLDSAIPPADVNGDGILDFFFADRILLGSNFLPTRDVPRTTTPAYVFDQDDDGDLDYIDDRGWVMKNVGGTEFEYGSLISDSFTAKYPIPLPGFMGFPGDYDGDGFIDLIRTELYNIKRDMVFRRGMAHGEFAANELVSIAFANNSLAADPIAFDTLNREGFAVDLDGDGDEDLATPNFLYINDGSGFFTEIAGPLAGLCPSDSGDVDNDGDVDLLCSGNKEGGNHVVVLRKQSSSISYVADILNGAPIMNPNDWILTRPIFEDLDEDGDLDVVAFSRSTTPGFADLLIWENTSPIAGGFILSSSLQVAFDDFMAARIIPQVVDFDGDGIKDIRVGPLRFKGTQTSALSGFLFVPPVPFQLGQSVPTYSFDRLIDLDGDGDLDLLGDVVIANHAVTRKMAGYSIEYGVSTPGSGGFRPVLTAQGPFSTGSTTANVRIARGVGQAAGVFAIGTLRVNANNFFGLNLPLYVDGVFSSTPITLGGTFLENGGGFQDFPFSVPPFLAGRTYLMQAGLVDAGSASGFVATNGLEIHFGQ